MLPANPFAARAPGETANMRLGTYVYGVIPTGVAPLEVLPGIDEGYPVQITDYKRMAALVSEVSLDSFESDSATDPGWVIPRALQHERVVEALAGLGPILPVRFGAVFATRAALDSWMVANEQTVRLFLDSVRDKEEWTVKGDLEPKSALECLVALDLAWAERAAGLSRTPGTRYFQEKRLRALARQQVQARAQTTVDRLRTKLSELADECSLALRAPGQCGIEPLMHAAYLVPRGSVAEFLRLVRQAADQAPCLTLLPAGPWPPSHFCPQLSEPPR